MAERPWQIDAGLARDLGEALGWSAVDGVAALAERIPERVPCGSTAKLAAVAAGEVPPGADVDGLARRVLDHLLAAAGPAGPAGGASSPSWSCWVTATVTAAVLDAVDLGPVDVAATRRTDDRSPVVDLHAAVVVGDDDGGGATWILDPYFGVAVHLADEVGAEGRAATPCAEAIAARPDRQGWTLDVRLLRWSGPLTYRVLGPALDRGDVHALAAISVAHSGVAARPYARLHVGGGVVDVRTDEAGAHLLTTWQPGGEPAEEAHPSWAAAADGFAARTGVRIV